LEEAASESPNRSFRLSRIACTFGRPVVDRKHRQKNSRKRSQELLTLGAGDIGEAIRESKRMSDVVAKIK